MRQTNPAAVAHAQLTGALFRLADVVRDDAEAVASVDECVAKVTERGGDPDQVRYQVEHALIERIALVDGHPYSSLIKTRGFIR